MARDLLLGSVARGWSRDSSGSDPLVWTPSAVRAELSRIRNLLDLANREVSQAVKDGKVTGPEWQSWASSYRTGHRLVDEASPMWGSNVAAARQHGAEAERWRALVRQRGGRSAGPEDSGRLAPTGGPGWLPSWLSSKALLAGAGGLVALAVVVSAVRK